MWFATWNLLVCIQSSGSLSHLVPTCLLAGFFKKLTDAEFELDEQEELMAELDDAIAAAPEAEDEEEDSEEESD
jgi:hypothetical protein